MGAIHSNTIGLYYRNPVFSYTIVCSAKHENSAAVRARKVGLLPFSVTNDLGLQNYLSSSAIPVPNLVKLGEISLLRPLELTKDKMLLLRKSVATQGAHAH